MTLGPKARAYIEERSTQESGGQPDYSIDGIGQLRESVKELYKGLLADVTLPAGIESKKVAIDTLNVETTIYQPSDADKPMPVIIFHPGGGLALDMAAEHAHICAEMSIAAGAAVVCIQPPLSPETKFPEILDASYNATKYFYENADKFQFDSQLFFLSGYSMGGTLAALITNRSRVDNDLNISGQVIISGVLDIANPPKTAGEDFMFNLDRHTQFIDMCLPKDTTVESIKGDENYSPLAANLAGLPPTILITGGNDALREDTRKFYKALKQAGVDTSMVENPFDIHTTLLMHNKIGDGRHAAILAGEEIADVISQPTSSCTWCC